MPKRKYQLTFLHKLCIVLFLVLACFAMTDREAFRYYQEENFKQTNLPFLPAGEYAMYVAYEGSPERNEICLSGDGAMEQNLITQEIAAGDGEILMQFSVKNGLHGVRISTKKGKGKCLRRIDLQSRGLSNRDGYFLAGLLLLSAIVVLLGGWYIDPSIQATIAALTGLGLLCSLPLFSESIMAAGGQDLQFHLVRIEGIYQGLLAGELPVRINAVQNAGFGNLSATMYPQLFLYPAAFLRMLGVSLLLSMKLLLVACNIATAFLSYCAMKAMTDSRKIAFTAAALYTFSMYRLSNLYFRAALGESLAMVFLPLLIWGVYEVLWRDARKWYLLMFGMTGVLQSHVLSCEMCAVFVLLEGVFWLILGERKSLPGRLRSIALAVLWTLLLNASFLVPFLYFCRQNLQAFCMPYTVPQSVAYFSQLFAWFIRPEGYNLEPGSTQGEMPISVGGILLVGVLLFLYVSFVEKKEKPGNPAKKQTALGLHCLCHGALAVLISSYLFPWEKLGEIAKFRALTASLQFAWRFLGPASALLCVPAAIGIVQASRERERAWIYGGCMALLVLGSGWFFDMTAHEMPQIADKVFLESLDTADSIYMFRESDTFTEIHSRYLRSDAALKTKYSTPFTIAEYERRGSKIRARVIPQSEEPDELMFPVYYYPGYEVRIDGRKVPCYPLVTWVTCQMPSGEAVVELSYRGLDAFYLADLVTLLSALGLSGWWCAHTWKKRKAVAYE